MERCISTETKGCGVADEMSDMPAEIEWK